MVPNNKVAVIKVHMLCDEPDDKSVGMNINVNQILVPTQFSEEIFSDDSKSSKKRTVLGVENISEMSWAVMGSSW